MAERYESKHLERFMCCSTCPYNPQQFRPRGQTESFYLQTTTHEPAAKGMNQLLGTAPRPSKPVDPFAAKRAMFQTRNAMLDFNTPSVQQLTHAADKSGNTPAQSRLALKNSYIVPPAPSNIPALIRRQRTMGRRTAARKQQPFIVQVNNSVPPGY